MANTVKSYTRKSQAERREEILDATLRLFGENGVHATTVAQIAEAVGVTPGALYRHFGNREAIVTAAIDLAKRRGITWTETSDAPDPLERLVQLGRNHGAWSREHLNTTARPLLQTIASAQNPEFVAEMNFLSWPSTQRLLEIADEGKRQGSIRPEVESEDVAWAMMGFNFVQDLALLMGADRAADGAIVRNLERLLDCFRPVEREPVITATDNAVRDE